MSAYHFGQIVSNCPLIETWVLDITTFDYNAALGFLGKSPCKRPINVWFNRIEASELHDQIQGPPYLTPASIEAFAHSDVKLNSFALVWENQRFWNPGIIAEIEQKMQVLKVVRGFSILTCPHIKKALVLGACRTLIYFGNYASSDDDCDDDDDDDDKLTLII
jgi:hypothetical protein